MSRINRFGTWITFTTAVGAIVAVMGCAKRGSFSQEIKALTDASNKRSAVVLLAPSFDIELWLAATPIYNEAARYGALNLIFNDLNNDLINDNAYNLKLNSSNANASFLMTIKRADGSTAVGNTPLTKGNNALPSLEVGSYTLTLTGSVPTVDPVNPSLTTTKNYSLAVQCGSVGIQLPTDASKILVNHLRNNVFEYDARSVVADPYLRMPDGSLRLHCAWDMNGDGITDTNFAPCANVAQGFSNHVATRSVGVLIQDRQCYYRQVFQFLNKSQNLAIPSVAPGEPYIKGTISQPALNSAQSLDRRTNLEHFSTNPTGYAAMDSKGNWSGGSPVTCSYSVNPAGLGEFAVAGLYQYEKQSLPSGLTIKVGNFLDNGLTEGTLNTSGAAITGSIFKTDMNADSQTRLEFSGGNCMVTDVQISKYRPTSTVCTGTSIPALSYTVRAQAQFLCLGMKNINPSNASSTIDVRNGAFSCEFVRRDSCQGAKPVPPKQF